MYRYPFGRKSGESQWEPAAHTVPRGDQTCAAPRDNTLPPHFLSAGGNLGSAFPSALVFRPRNELSRLARQPRPDLGSGPRCGRFRRRASGCGGRLRRRCRARPARHAEAVHSAVPPERLIGAFERRRGASTRIPNALHRVASPQPRCDLLLALNKTGVRLALWSLRRPITDLGISVHNPVIGFGDPKYSQMGRFFSSDARFLAGICCSSLSVVGTPCTCASARSTG